MGACPAACLSNPNGQCCDKIKVTAVPLELVAQQSGAYAGTWTTESSHPSYGGKVYDGVLHQPDLVADAQLQAKLGDTTFVVPPIEVLPEDADAEMICQPVKDPPEMARTDSKPDCEICRIIERNRRRHPTRSLDEGSSGGKSPNRMQASKSNNMVGAPSIKYKLHHGNSSDGTPLSKARAPLTLVFESAQGSQITTVFTEQPIGILLEQDVFPLTVQHVKHRSPAGRAMVIPGWKISMIDEIDVMRGGYTWDECVHFLLEGTRRQRGSMFATLSSKSNSSAKSSFAI
mmetsp:Transcript_31181/g.56963  ORF Transcript_31181/g.56963 Transcript_31181/m.56963 type:complete len:288 (+) Transcript_31181:78-941(+)